MRVIIFLLALVVPANANPIHSLVDQYADRHGVPRNIAHAVIKMESGYRPNIRGKDGEYGLGQIMCQTARGEGFTGDCSRLFDPATNLNFSMSYLAKALARGGGNLCVSLTYYNAGLHARPHCNGYGQRVATMAGKQ